MSPASAGKVNGLLVQRTNGKIRVVAALLQSNLTTPELATLLRYAAGDAQGIQVYNEAEGSPLLERCLQLGFAEWFSQNEMFLHLSGRRMGQCVM